jgi:sporulation integral membrane protein YlbJ
MKKSKLSRLIICSIFLLLLICCFKYPIETYESAKYSFLLWLNKLAPFLFIFFILNSILIRFGIINLFKPLFYPLSKLYSVSPISLFAVLAGYLGGQPTGIKIAADLYLQDKITRQDALSITTFCSITSPAFMLSSIGILFYNDNTVGIILIISSILSALITGLLFADQTKPLQIPLTQPAQAEKINFTKIFITSVTDSTYTVLLVGSYIVFFGICVGVLNTAGVFDTVDIFINTLGFHLPEGVLTSLLWGFFEITGGCDKIFMLNITLIPKIILTSMILNWGGLSVHAQCISFLDNANLNKTPYLKAKSVQPFIAALISYTICILIY